MNRTLALLLALAGLVCAVPVAHAAAVCPSPDAADSPAELLGQPARAWTFDRWIRTPPIQQESLRGKIVLVRWFTEDCHYCKSTLPQLEKLQKQYGRDGLVVLCVFHPKPQRHLSDGYILKVANRLGWSGPVAVDERWSTLDRWWLDGHPERNWTSVSFLMDQAGVVRWAHSGGEYHPSTDPRHAPCARQYAELETLLQQLIAAPRAAN